MAPSEFVWLTDLHKSQCYTTGDWNNPAKTIDFGDNGHTASLTDWHEILQITAPDPICGIVFVRGDFPNKADAILARAQQSDTSGKKSTFGLEIESNGSDFVLGEKRNQGFVNFRWPYIQYELKRKYPDGGVEQIHIGAYETISFVKDGVIFQVACIRPGRIHTSAWDRSMAKPSRIEAETVTDQKELKIRFRMGGSVQFGCPCSGGRIPDNEEPPPNDVQRLLAKEDESLLFCVNNGYQKRFGMQVFVNDELRTLRRPLSEHGPLREGKEHSFAYHDVEIVAGSATFIVAAYALRDCTITGPILKPDSFKYIADYLGVSNDSKKMSDRLWTACLTTNYDAAEAMEFCAIGTAVEQTLCVSSVPMSMRLNAETPLDIIQYPSKVNHENEWEYKGVALIRNIMIGQYVDLQSTFWQIRLLVKVHDFLRSRKFEPDLLDGDRPLKDVRNFYLSMLRNHIRKSLVWLMGTTMEPRKILLAVDTNHQLNSIDAEINPRRVTHRRALIKVDSSLDQACFVTVTFWFVMKYCPEAITVTFKTRIVLPALKQFHSWIERQDSQDESDSTTKTNVLRWVQLSCFILICQESFGKDENDQDIDGFAASGISRQDTRRSQERCENSITRLRKGKTEAYSVEDEEVDRLFLLTEELGFQALRSQASSSLAIARAKQTRTKIAERKQTIRFHPGPKPYKPGDTSQVTSNGPWELSCLNHHTSLWTTLDRSFDISVQDCRNACFEFLLSGYTFMSSWDRADKAMIEKWWDFETASVICATLLDLKTSRILKSAEPEQKIDDSSKSVTDATLAPLEGEGQVNQTGLLRGNLPRADSLRDLLQLLKQELLQNESGSMTSNKPFDWLAWKPARHYHPVCWAKLLNGITKVSNLKGITKIPSQSEIIKYLSGSDENNRSKSLESHMEDIGQLLGEDLDYISIFDLVANYDFTFRSREHQRYDYFPALKVKGPSEDISMTRNGIVNPKSNSQLQRPSSLVRLPEQPVHENTLALLNRTLVDSETKYRILFAERCSPPILKAFICGWHPDAVDTFDNYFGTSSRFSDSREAVWTTTITVSHWSIQNTDSSKEYPKRFHEGRIKGDFPPASIANLKSANGRSEQGKIQNEKPIIRLIEERSTSMVVTGDSQGFFWICTIWSSLTKYKHLAASVNSLPAVLQSFIHQQASGRCLVFLILLGHLCERLAKEHEKMLKQLNTVVDLGEKILLDGIELEASDAVEKLERMLWGLEALRVFDDRLSTSLTQIRKAKETLEHKLDQEAVQQNVELVQEYKNVLEEFGDRYCILRDVQIKIQLRIRQVTGLRDGISTVTNVKDRRAALKDSQTTIKQGNNIRVLTLITIAYLPLGFVTSLFSNNQNLLPEGTGITLYIILSVVLSIVTYIVALFLGTILSIFQPGWDDFKTKVMPGSAKGFEIKENGAMIKQSSGNGSHSKARLSTSGSDRGNILPLTKENESSGTYV